MQKTALKNTKASKNETILEISHFAKALAPAQRLQDTQFGTKMKNAGNMPRIILEDY